MKYNKVIILKGGREYTWEEKIRMCDEKASGIL